MPRHLSEDTTFQPHTLAIQLHEVQVLAAALQTSDLWLRFMPAELLQQDEVWAYTSRASAIESTPPASWVGHAVFARSYQPVVIELEPTPVAPGGTPLKITVTSGFPLEAPGCLWVSDYSPDQSE